MPLLFGKQYCSQGHQTLVKNSETLTYCVTEIMLAAFKDIPVYGDFYPKESLKKMKVFSVHPSI